ncbi:hypothetical protein IU470_18735 [Nocardia abscessus]|uniref:Uncharacterized protein n=1 Tax=Nocardia abscessus TaxID=120957 RepID=A0ABS0C9U6_9NOCA|nr:hypothetical protein [Nocardia abscessus]
MGARVPRKKLTIEFDEPLPPELYANIASVIWLQVRAMSDAANFEFDVRHDGPASMSKELNEHWERFAEEARWETE